MNKTYNQLAIDQSTTATGWCAFIEGKYHASGVFAPEGRTTDERIKEVHDFIKSAIKQFKIRVVSVEDIYLKERPREKYGTFKPAKGIGENVNVHKILGELLGACKMAVYSEPNIIRLAEINPPKWKSHFNMLGKGKDRDTQKNMAIVKACEISGKKVVDDNEADAICMADFFNKAMFDTNEELRKGEFKIPCYPHVFRYFDKKIYNELGEKLQIKLEKEVKEVIGKTPNGKNKWGKTIKQFLPSELSSLNKSLKLQFMEKLKERGFKSKLSELVWNENMRFLTEEKSDK